MPTTRSRNNSKASPSKHKNYLTDTKNDQGTSSNKNRASCGPKQSESKMSCYKSPHHSQERFMLNADVETPREFSSSMYLQLPKTSKCVDGASSHLNDSSMANLKHSHPPSLYLNQLHSISGKSHVTMDMNTSLQNRCFVKPLEPSLSRKAMHAKLKQVNGPEAFEEIHKIDLSLNKTDVKTTSKPRGRKPNKPKEIDEKVKQ